MASQGAAFLMQANLLPALGNEVWNTSSILSENSPLGFLLHVLIGDSAQPAGNVLFRCHCDHLGPDAALGARAGGSQSPDSDPLELNRQSHDTRGRGIHLALPSYCMPYRMGFTVSTITVFLLIADVPPSSPCVASGWTSRLGSQPVIASNVGTAPSAAALVRRTPADESVTLGQDVPEAPTCNGRRPPALARSGGWATK
jgi:hypothetical protein